MSSRCTTPSTRSNEHKASGQRDSDGAIHGDSGEPDITSAPNGTTCSSQHPEEQELPQNMGPPLDELRRRLGGLGNNFCEEEVHYYIITSVHIIWRGVPPIPRFSQRGSGPNFFNGVITLCTCKHTLRTVRTCSNWKKGVWIAGFSSLKQDPAKQFLFYLIRVGDAYPSHAGLYGALPRPIATGKNARNQRFGDLYEPRNSAATHNPTDYYVPVLGHPHHKLPSDTTWHDDIQLKNSKVSCLLVGEEGKSFVWTCPTIYLDRSIELIGRQRYARRSRLCNLLSKLK